MLMPAGINGLADVKVRAIADDRREFFAMQEKDILANMQNRSLHEALTQFQQCRPHPGDVPNRLTLYIFPHGRPDPGVLQEMVEQDPLERISEPLRALIGKTLAFLGPGAVLRNGVRPVHHFLVAAEKSVGISTSKNPDAMATDVIARIIKRVKTGNFIIFIHTSTLFVYNKKVKAIQTKTV